MTTMALTSPDDQGATFVELFFDLVFVFAITQVTHFAAHHFDMHGLLRSVLVFWMVWWGWTQFTWSLNAANTDHHHVRVGTLVSTGVAFVMAVAVGKAFGEPREAILFALSYGGVRLLGLGLYYRVVFHNVEQRTSVLTYGALSLTGVAAVIVGSLVDPALREWVWLGAIFLDLVAAGVAGNKGSWGLHAGHFAERHGLIVIIALGESLIVAGASLTSGVSTSLMFTGGLAVVLTCLLWWTYFGWVREVLERAMLDRDDVQRTKLGRDAFSFGHFPLVSGIIAMAVGFEAAFHPTSYTPEQIAIAAGLGLALFLGATAIALWRANGCVLWNRLVVVFLTLWGMALSTTSTSSQILGIACAGLTLIVVWEQLTVRKRLEA